MRGEEFTREDETVVRGIRKLSGAKGPRVADRTVLEAVEKILTPEQIQLLGQPARELGNLEDNKTKKLLARATLKQMTRAAAIPQDQWPQRRDQAADKLVAGIVDEQDRAATRENVVAFLDRIRDMDRKEFEDRMDELTEELAALFPEDAPNPQALDVLAPQTTPQKQGKDAINARKQAAALVVFLSPEVPRLLEEMKRDRVQ